VLAIRQGLFSVGQCAFEDKIAYGPALGAGGVLQRPLHGRAETKVELFSACFSASFNASHFCLRAVYSHSTIAPMPDNVVTDFVAKYAA
jgi:hypothetical protein